MKLYCPDCGRKKELDDNKKIVMAICYRCQEWMIELKEDNENGRKHISKSS